MTPRTLAATMTLATALAACSSAPAPNTLSAGGTTGGAGTAGSTTGTAGTGTTGVPAAGATGTTTPAGTSGSAASTGGTGTTSGSGTSGTGAGTTGAGGSTSSSGTVPTVNVPQPPPGGGGGGSTLFSGAANVEGITPTSITMCAHAALSYGAAFNTKDTDLNVFWQAVNQEKGGIFGRQVKVTYENDNYSPDTAVVAAQTCADKGIFMLLGGIGFDQIPAVRNWAESHKMLYLHHTATVEGSAGLKYSFTELPTVERMGDGFAQLYLSKFKGKKVGIIERDGVNWKPGADHFKAGLKSVGLADKIVADQKVADKKGNYTSDILAMKNAGAEVVFLWENALNGLEYLKQSKAQQFSPHYMAFPFNLTSQTLDGDALTPPLDGVAMYPAYSKGDYTAGFASYADDVKLFEAQYAKYDSGVDLGGVGGDLLFLNWTAQKALYAQFLACGKDCTRDKFIDVLQTYHSRPTSSACLIDFTNGDGHHGADELNFMETYASPSGKVNWRNTQACVKP
jgi:ABC-type branched-subunit amino acid transport system substrate-binding protein